MRSSENMMEEISVFNTEDESKKQYLSFILAGEEYGIDILRVQEIKGWENVTKIPNAPHYIKGVMNLRGVIVPIVDLRNRFGLGEQEYGPTTVVIVLKIEADDKQRIMGIVVDAVSDVYDIESDFMKPPPDFGNVVSIEFVQGLATVNEKMVIVLNVNYLLNYSELDSLHTDSSVKNTGGNESAKPDHPIDNVSNA